MSGQVPVAKLGEQGRHIIRLDEQGRDARGDYHDLPAFEHDSSVRFLRHPLAR